MITVERTIQGKKISIETNRVAKQANGAVLVRSAESIVLVTACLGGDKAGDFLPLTIDYIEKSYAAGKIPGGFFKREGKLSEEAVLNSRLIDRPCRPLFPEGFTHEIQVIATVLSADPEADTDVLALCGASAALTISDIPFEGPVAGVRVARIGGKFLINPARSDLPKADLSFIVAGTRDAIVMVEGEADEIPEDVITEALFTAHKEFQPIIEMQDELRKKVGKPKVEIKPKARDEELAKKIEAMATPHIKAAVKVKDKLERRGALEKMREEIKAAIIVEGDADAEKKKALISKVCEDISYDVVRGNVFDTGIRIDGRDGKTIRPIDIEVKYLPRVHGSALFTRGETQAIVTATLGVEQEAQIIDSLWGEGRKRFMLHYNFPPFSVGETKPMRGPGRREYGHGALAERALSAVLPTKEQFPYVLRIVSEITESNGSSSMATVCGGSLALMDAGVPIKGAVAGVAMGLMKDGDRYAILSDILGDEDHLGDMDFKVCGTEKGITALQMDIKIKGLSRDIVTAALEQAREGRLHILGKMNEAMNTPRTDLSAYAPRIITFKVNQNKIKDIIGPGGKTIRSITESCDVKMDVQDDGTVTISGSDAEQIRAARAICDSLTAEAEVGKLYKGIVKKIADFGAFVEILPGVDGLLHISQIADNKIRRVTDVLQEGDETWVKVLEVDRQGKIRLSRREAMYELQQESGS